MRYTPDDIRKLDPTEVFVFASNLAGRHGKGAALVAKKRFGAQYGVGLGFTGQCYAIPTKDFNLNTMSLDEIEAEIKTFLYYPANNKQWTFLVTKIGCGLAGYEVKDIAPLFFKHGPIPENVILPKEFWEWKESQKS